MLAKNVAARFVLLRVLSIKQLTEFKLNRFGDKSFVRVVAELTVNSECYHILYYHFTTKIKLLLKILCVTGVVHSYFMLLCLSF